MGIGARITAEAEKRPWLDHLIRAAKRYSDQNGNHLAAAITYFSMLALFPLLLLAVSIAGFILSGHPDQFRDLQNSITDNAPSGLKDILKNAVNAAVRNKAGILSVGLLGAAYAGLGWVGNLRTAVQALWGETKPKTNFLTTKLRDLVALVGLGLAALVSVCLTTAGTSATRTIMTHTGLEDVWGAAIGTRIVGIVVAIAADVLIFAWMIARLPNQPVAIRSVLKGALLAAVGFEGLKIAATYYLPAVSHSPAAGIFGIVLGFLVWINLVARFLLFATAWTATSRANRALAAEVANAERALPAGPKDEPAPADAVPAGPNGAVLAAGIFGAGAASGVAVTGVVRKRLSRRRDGGVRTGS